MAKPLTSVAEELKQNRPFATGAEEAVVAVMRTAALIKRAISQQVEPFGVSLAQYNVLRILRGAGAEGLPTLAVRDRLIEEAPGITRLIDKLEAAKLVRRDRTGRDRRTVRCHITDSGRKLLEELDLTLRGGQELVAAGLPDPAAQHSLIEMLAQVRSGLR